MNVHDRRTAMVRNISNRPLRFRRIRRRRHRLDVAPGATRPPATPAIDGPRVLKIIQEVTRGDRSAPHEQPNDDAQQRQERTERNRRNASHSTGPRTPEGKRRSSMNAVKHGLYAKSPLVRGEDPAAFEALRKGFLNDLCPFGTVEYEIAEDAADAAWRKRRYRRIEAEIFEEAFDAADAAVAASEPRMSGSPDSDPAPEAPAAGGSLALTGDSGRKFVVCQRAGIRAMREFRSALGDLTRVRAARDRCTMSWHESSQARFTAQFDGDLSAAPVVHPDSYFHGHAESLRMHPPVVTGEPLGRSGSPDADPTSAARDGSPEVGDVKDASSPVASGSANLRVAPAEQRADANPPPQPSRLGGGGSADSVSQASLAGSFGRAASQTASGDDGRESSQGSPAGSFGRAASQTASGDDGRESPQASPAEHRAKHTKPAEPPTMRGLG
jgi:hypothetical protein